MKDMPRHVAFILDGNGRWAKKKNMPRTYGHAAGAKRVEPIVRYCDSLGIEYVTMYAFSTENWSRPEEEVATLMKLLKKYLKRCFDLAMKNNMTVRIIGDVPGLDREMQDIIADMEETTGRNTGLTFAIALNYGGRDEIVRAVGKALFDDRLKAEIAEKGLKEALSEERFSDYLDTAGMPDPDLLIRTSGEQRTSNFLPWQLCYTEFYFTDTPWPDFDEHELDLAIEAYRNRDRRYGGV